MSVKYFWKTHIQKQETFLWNNLFEWILLDVIGFGKHMFKNNEIFVEQLVQMDFVGCYEF